MWYTATSASVTNGSDVVTITTGDDISIVQENSGLVFEDSSPVEVLKAYIDIGGNKVIQLARPWPYSTKTNQPLVAYPTDASFAEATAELRRVIDTLTVASTAEAQLGEDDEKIMTPLKVKQSIDFNAGAGVDERIVQESGTSTTDIMSQNAVTELVTGKDQITKELNSTFDAGSFVTFPEIPVSSGTNKWSGGVLARNGYIYMIPYSASQVLKLDTVTREFTLFGNFSGGAKYGGGVLAKNDKIYCTPTSSGNILVIDTTDDSTYTIPAAYGNVAYIGGCLSTYDDKIYFSPFSNEGAILVIDPFDDTLSTISTGISTDNAFSGVCNTLDGKLVFAPSVNEEIMVFDPDNGSISLIAISGLSGTAFSSVTLTYTGALYFSPRDANFILKFDPSTNITTKIPTGLSGENFYQGASAAPDGKVYFIPREADQMMILDPSDDTISFIGKRLGNFYDGGVVGGTGDLFLVPRDADSIKVIPRGLIGGDNIWVLSPYFNKF